MVAVAAVQDRQQTAAAHTIRLRPCAAPQVPMLFMGKDSICVACTVPFLFAFNSSNRGL